MAIRAPERVLGLLTQQSSTLPKGCLRPGKGPERASAPLSRGALGEERYCYVMCARKWEVLRR